MKKIKMTKTIQILIIVVAFMSFVPHVDAAWFDSNYTYCRKMTMTAGGGSGGVATTTTAGLALVATSTISTLAATSSSGNIQVLDSTNNTPFDVAITNGTDCNSDGGSLIDFYFEKYASTTGEFTLWVEPTDISSTTAKTVLMYYGNSAGTDQSDEAGVFSASGEVGVWDFSEDPSGGAPQMLDSTSNNHDGTSNGSMTSADQVAGQIDGSLDFDGGNDYIDVGNFEIVGSQLTLSVWINFDTINTDARIVVKATTGGTAYWRLQVEDTGNVLRMGIRTGGVFTNWTTTIEMPLNTWVHYVFTYDGSNVFLYKDGAQVFTAEKSGTIDTNASGLVWVGDDAKFDRQVDGKIDDVRIYNRGLSAMDVLTNYNNTVDSTTFWTFGAEETAAEAVPARTLRLFEGFTIKLFNGRIILHQKQ